MEPTGNFLEDSAQTFKDAVTDPDRMWLFFGPVLVFAVLLVIVLLLRARNRQKERAVVEAYLKDEKETPVTAAPEPEAPAAPSDVSDIRNLDQQSWLRRLSDGLKKTRDQWSTGLTALFTGKTPLTPALKDKIQETLFRADLGVSTSNKLVGFIEQDAKGEDLDWERVRGILKTRVTDILKVSEKPVATPDKPPFVLLVVGVNGVGKTTTVAKLAASYLAQDKSVLLCAADTFRAAAIDQLKEWGRRLEVDVIAHQQGSDPAAVAYDGVKAAIARNSDVLIVDTAGRLHGKKELMDELGKIKRVLGRDKEGAPHETWLVVDATTGQNALMQIKAFSEVVQLTGIVVTKLDGTAKGGVLIAAADQFKLPIHYIGVGEKAADLRPFSAEQYANSLL